jgi:hypothetical protein
VAQGVSPEFKFQYRKKKKSLRLYKNYHLRDVKSENQQQSPDMFGVRGGTPGTANSLGLASFMLSWDTTQLHALAFSGKGSPHTNEFPRDSQGQDSLAT